MKGNETGVVVINTRDGRIGVTGLYGTPSNRVLSVQSVSESGHCAIYRHLEDWEEAQVYPLGTAVVDVSEFEGLDLNSHAEAVFTKVYEALALVRKHPEEPKLLDAAVDVPGVGRAVRILKTGSYPWRVLNDHDSGALMWEGLVNMSKGPIVVVREGISEETS